MANSRKKSFTRRQFIATSAAATATTVAAPFVHTAGAAGSLTMALWDHWVPGANTAMTEICQAWADKEKVDLKIDYLSTQGNKLYLTIAAEALARSGHDIVDFSAFEPARYEKLLEPVDDVMKEVTARNGPVGTEYEYLVKLKGTWLGVPGIRGTLLLPACSRIDLMKQHAGVDILAMFPAGAEPTKAADAWTWDAFLVAAEKAHKAGFAFGLPLGGTTDAAEWLGAFLAAHGAELVGAKGDIKVKSDPVRAALEYLNRLSAFLPPDASAWDNSSNNKWLVAGKGALIFNPPSAWAVAKRDAPQVAEQLWTHAMPKGPKGRCVSTLPRFQGLWNFAKNKSAAKALMLHVSSREAAEKLVAACDGYDVPPYPSFHDFKTWKEVGPPKGTLSHYPNRGDQRSIIPYAPAPLAIADQIYTQSIAAKMVVRMLKGEQIAQTLDWAEKEIEGFARN
ncbi:MAG TPA: ABC transporter substrate-binding protein [Hyphomicrobiaceae bacterium]|nr:ABC transporter substrate-binding protein [Hyphomicrobiaceae bacterium]